MQNVKNIYSSSVNVTAGGSGDNTALTGDAIDTQDKNGGLLTIAGTTTLGATETLEIKTVKITHADTSDGTFTDYQDITVGEVAVGGTGGSTETFEFNHYFVAKNTKRFIKVVFTPDLSRANTDTARVFSVVGLEGTEAPV